MAACKPKTPSQYIQPKEMEDLLVDFHMARAMGQLHGSYDEQTYRKQLCWQAALQKHGVTEAEFDSSLVYYYTHAERLEDIYKQVLSRLQNQALMLGASEGEIGRYADLTENGDTANIWHDGLTMMLMPKAPYHCRQFSVSGDSLFRNGDEFLIQFVSDFVYQSGSKDGFCMVAIDYPDTVITRQTRFSYSGLNQLNIKPREKSCPQRVRGYFYLGGSNDVSTTLRMLFIKDIQLIRFHQKKDEKAIPAKTDSITSTDAAKRKTVEPSRSGNSSGASASILPVTRGTSPNRMVERIDSAKSKR